MTINASLGSVLWLGVLLCSALAAFFALLALPLKSSSFWSLVRWLVTVDGFVRAHDRNNRSSWTCALTHSTKQEC